MFKGRSFIKYYFFYVKADLMLFYSLSISYLGVTITHISITQKKEEEEKIRIRRSFL